MNLDETKRRRRGPRLLAAEEKRSHCVSVHLNARELAQLDAQREKPRMERGEYLRAAGLHRLPPVIPEINAVAWAQLARVAGNLNQLVKHLNQTGVADVRNVKAVLDELRLALIGAKASLSKGGEDES